MFVFGIRKSLNDCSAKQKTDGATLILAAIFPKTTTGSIAEKSWMRQYKFGIYLYQNNTGNFFSHTLSSLQRLLKTIREFCKYFGRTLFANMSK